MDENWNFEDLEEFVENVLNVIFENVYRNRYIELKVEIYLCKCMQQGN